MLNQKNRWVLAMVVLGVSILTATPAFARGINFKDAGFAIWIFIAIGAAIILLQLIPAAILFFSFIGTTSTVIFKGKKPEDAPEVTPGYQPAQVKK
jgi:hypothetical protein